MVCLKFVLFSQAGKDVYELHSHTVFEDMGLSSAFKPESITFVLYETAAENMYTPSLRAFLETSKTLSGVDAVVVGTNSAFFGFGSKYRALVETLVDLERNDNNTLVMLLDARDIVLNVAVDKENIAIKDFEPRLVHYLESYSKLTQHNPGSVVVSAEAQCCVAAMSWAHPSAYFNTETGEREQRACNSGEEGCLYWPTENIELWKTFMIEKEMNSTRTSQNSFLNAGLMMGRSKNLLELIARLDLHEYEDDQAVLSGYLFHFPDEIQLDYRQEIFGNNQWPDGLSKGCMFDYSDSLDSDFLEHKVTGATPLLLHASGKFYDCLDYMIDKLGGHSEARYIEKPINERKVYADDSNSNTDLQMVDDEPELEGPIVDVLFNSLEILRNLRKKKNKNYSQPKKKPKSKKKLLRRLLADYESA